MQNEFFFIKIDKLWGTIFVGIFLHKRIYHSIKEYTLMILSPYHNLKDDNYQRHDDYLF